MYNIDRINEELKHIYDSGVGINKIPKIIEELNGLKENYSKKFCNKYYRKLDGSHYITFVKIDDMRIDSGNIYVNGWSFCKNTWIKEETQFDFNILENRRLCEVPEFKKEYREFDISDESEYSDAKILKEQFMEFKNNVKRISEINEL